MRQVSIPKNFVEALNSIFDSHPEAVTELMAVRAPATQEEGKPEPVIGLLDIINAALDSVAPGKRIATIHGPDGFDGFVLGRDKKPQPSPAED